MKDRKDLLWSGALQDLLISVSPRIQHDYNAVEARRKVLLAVSRLSISKRGRMAELYDGLEALRCVMSLREIASLIERTARWEIEL